jgi:hypothetical protein
MKMLHALPTARGSVTRLLLPLLVCALMLACVPGWALGATGQASQTGGSSAAGQPGTSGGAPVVSATLEQCLDTGEQADRTAAFSGSMTTVAGAARMTIKIELQERMLGEALFHSVSAPGLGMWRGSDTGVKIYKYVKQFTNLSSPAAYRALVRFHWLDDKGHVIRRAERLTYRCVQPASVLTRGPTPPGTSTPPSTG